MHLPASSLRFQKWCLQFLSDAKRPSLKLVFARSSFRVSSSITNWSVMAQTTSTKCSLTSTSFLRVFHHDPGYSDSIGGLIWARSIRSYSGRPRIRSRYNRNTNRTFLLQQGVAEDAIMSTEWLSRVSLKRFGAPWAHRMLQNLETRQPTRNAGNLWWTSSS